MTRTQHAALAKAPSVLANSRSVKNKPSPTFGKCLRVPFLTKQSGQEEIMTLPTVIKRVFANRVLEKKSRVSFVVIMLVCMGRDCVIPSVPSL